MPHRDEIKDQVREATDIVQLLGEDVTLHAKGREYAAVCPFHDDHSPSMTISRKKQIYKCFACGAGGDVFSWMVNYHNLTFPEALKQLADRAGIDLPTHGEKSDGNSPRERIAAVNELTMNLYRRMLAESPSAEHAREYVKQRGISDEMVEKFKLGFAGSEWDTLSRHAAKHQWDVAAMEMAGLVRQRSSSSGLFDFLHHRLIFPIMDRLGRPIAFAGRKLDSDDDGPKYLNVAETPLFNKSGTLYGIHEAQRPIIEAKTAVIVEGYTDVIACHQAGVKNVIATMGTSLTADHAKALGRYAERVVLIFDADEAGQKAADRALEVFFRGEMDVAIVVLPEGQDPADLLQQEDGHEAWQQAIDDATDALDYQFGRIRHQFDHAQSLTGRQRLIDEYLDKLAGLGITRLDTVRRGLVVQRLAQLIGLESNELNRLLADKARAARAPKRAPREAAPAPSEPAGPISTDDTPYDEDAPHPADLELDADGNIAAAPADDMSPAQRRAMQQAEQRILGCLLKDPGLFVKPQADGRALDELVTPSEFTDPPCRALYEHLYDRLAEEQTVTLAGFVSDLTEGEQGSLANLATTVEAEVESYLDDGSDHDLERVLRDAVAHVQRHWQQQEYRQARRALVEALDGRSDTPPDPAMHLAQVAETLRANASPARLLRRRPAPAVPPGE